MRAAVFLCMILLALTPKSAVADVGAQLSASEAYVGMPVTLYVQVAGAESQRPPTIPPIDGLKIAQARQPSFSTATIIRNGRRTVTSQLTFSFRITPEKPGEYRIPPLSIQTTDGVETTRPVAFSVKTSETGDLLFADVEASLDKVYVGQPIILTLRLWLKPYVDEQRDFKFSHRQMWDRVRQTQSDWGVFSETLEELAENGEGIRAATALHANGDGEDEPYYLYEIEATVHPKQAGMLSSEGMNIIVHYPTELGESNDLFDSVFGSSPFSRRSSPFGRSLEVSAARPITVQPDFPPIQIAAIPSDNRPEFYQGAVGQFAMVTRATPDDVQAGDPITLTIGIRGTGPMEGVQAPPLASIGSLTQDFRVADEPLAGIVQDDVKVFSTTIRPRDENVSEIPAIPFSYFDPIKETFITAKSDPIPIAVRKADQLSLESIVGGATTPPLPDQETDTQDAGPDLTLRAVSVTPTSDRTTNSRSFWWAWLLAAPTLYVVALLVRYRDRFVANPSSLRRVSADLSSTDDPRVVANRTSDFALARGDRLPEKLAADVAELSRRCDAAVFAKDAGEPLDALKQTADGILNRVSKIPPLRSRRLDGAIVKRALLKTAAVLVLFSLTVFSLVPFLMPRATTEGSDAALQLAIEQQRVLLAEANEAYQKALRLQEKSPADSKDAFATAAQKYQLLVDSGVQDADVYFNLANASLKSDAIGHAIANYRRAKKLRPLDFSITANLRFAQERVSDSGKSAEASAGSWIDLMRKLILAFPTLLIVWLVLIAWSIIWLVMLLRASRPGDILRRLLISTTVVLLLSTVWLAFKNSVDTQSSSAVVVTRTPAIYSGSSETFDPIPSAGITIGETLQVIQRRGQWIQVQTSGGTTGWMRASELETV